MLLGAFLQFSDHQVHNLADFFHPQLREHDYFIYPVEELRTELLLEFFLYPILHPLIGTDLVIIGLETGLHPFIDFAGAQVGRHDDYGVLEVHHPPLRISEPPVL